eukprot:scaffold22688_cov55-Phaeocystis_antarctica.AAC.5
MRKIFGKPDMKPYFPARTDALYHTLSRRARGACAVSHARAESTLRDAASPSILGAWAAAQLRPSRYAATATPSLLAPNIARPAPAHFATSCGRLSAAQARAVHTDPMTSAKMEEAMAIFAGRSRLVGESRAVESPTLEAVLGAHWPGLFPVRIPSRPEPPGAP